jgi:hypothetical protein
VQCRQSKAIRQFATTAEHKTNQHLITKQSFKSLVNHFNRKPSFSNCQSFSEYFLQFLNNCHILGIFSRWQYKTLDQNTKLYTITLNTQFKTFSTRG